MKINRACFRVMKSSSGRRLRSSVLGGGSRIHETRKSDQTPLVVQRLLFSAMEIGYDVSRARLGSARRDLRSRDIYTFQFQNSNYCKNRVSGSYYRLMALNSFNSEFKFAVKTMFISFFKFTIQIAVKMKRQNGNCRVSGS